MRELEECSQIELEFPFFFKKKRRNVILLEYNYNKMTKNIAEEILIESHQNEEQLRNYVD